VIRPTNAAEGERRSPPALRAILVLALGLAPFFLLRVNLTRSLPRGVYLLLPWSRPHEGQLVTFCPPSWLGPVLLRHHLSTLGPCPSGTLPFAKRLAAIGPYACASSSGLILNRDIYPWPALPPYLALPLYARCGPTAPSCAFVLGEGDSIDSRIFGCVPLPTLESPLIPLLTERNRG